MSTLVRNAGGTAELSCKCGSWLKHWERGAGKSALGCGVVACMGSADDGAHVRRVGSQDRSVFIVPMCHSHNLNTTDDLSIKDSVPLISANKQNTCA